jgi:hypothetical protein
MTPTPSFREIETLSAYLDGQLKPSEAAALESRLEVNPEMRAALEGLRQARGVLRRLPQRRAPRNFTLTPKMVGLNPPLPRSYPAFRFATVIATVLLFLSFATNFMATRIPAQAPSIPYGIGGGGGADQESMEPALAAEAPAEPAAPAAEEPDIVVEPTGLEPAAPEPAAPEFAAQSPATPSPRPEEDAFRAQATPAPTQALADQVEEKSGVQNQLEEGEDAGQALVVPSSPAPGSRPVPVIWQLGLVVLVILNSLILLLLRRNAASRWRDTK